MPLKILILGANGFVGHKLTHTILQSTDWEVYGMDIGNNKLEASLGNSRFYFMQGDMLINQKWVEEHVKKCDVVLPLVAIANPATYVEDPLSVFALDFEANLPIIRYCVQYKTRVVFPSTSEVYGMSDEDIFDEETSRLVLGPIQKERWIYGCSKQLLDRIIYAYGKHQDLAFTLFRPFNWIGPQQDNVYDPKSGSSRVVSQFISRIIHGTDIQLVNGGLQRRCFTFLDDGIACLLKIIENKEGCANSRIFNIGNPKNDVSIKELAELLLNLAKTFPRYAEQVKKIKIVTVNSTDYYGKGYQDVLARVPAIKNAQQYLGWYPTTDLKTALHETLRYYSDNIS